MVFILSIEGDVTTDEVCKYIMLYNHNFCRINDNFLSVHSPEIVITKEKKYLTIKNFNIELNNNLVVWYRKFGFYKYSGNNQRITNPLIDSFISNEYYTLINFILNSIPGKNLIGKPKIGFNKLIQLEIANEIGLKVPEYIITNKLSELKNFIRNDEKYIVKPLLAGKQINLEENYFKLITLELFQENLTEIGETFFPSIVQSYIEKEFEIRAFYLDGKIYSMAIFSQSNDETKIDFRNISASSKNRMVPFNLPRDVEDKLRKFMEYFKLETGSFDLIYNSQDGFVFLEVNPSGQFGMTSVPCNYNLESEMAKYLITKSGL